MSEAKFTKGPWSVSTKARGCATVCTVTRTVGIKANEIPEQDPIHDAHLIAAAPEMYESLSEMKQVIENGHELGEMISRIQDFGEEIDKLLAKARGESQ